MDAASLTEEISEIVLQKLEFLDPAAVMNSICKVVSQIKLDYKLAKCSDCKKYKIAGTKCRTDYCSKFMSSQECPKCKRTFVKMGNHKCLNNIRIASDIAVKTKSKHDDTHVVIPLETNTINFELF